MSAKGGITEGKSHKEGGIPMVVKSTGQQVELEGGEGVINKRNMASNKTFNFEGKELTICEIASQINKTDGNGVEIDCSGVVGKKYKYNDGGMVRTLQMHDAVLYKGQLYYLTEKNGVIGIINLQSGAWGSDYPFIPLSRIDIDTELTDMSGNRINIIDEYEEGGSLPNADKLFHLPIEMAVYVPSTQDVDKVISTTEMKKRVTEVSKYLANLFGGFTRTDKVGGYLASNNKVVVENVEPVTAFATKHDFNKHKNELISKLSEWARRWGQESIGFEYEGDLYYVGQEFKNGGSVSVGTRHEMEHADTINKYKRKDITTKQVARAIATDHIKENPNYYNYLRAMEREIKKGISGHEVHKALSEHDRIIHRKRNKRKYALGGYMPNKESIHISVKEDYKPTLFHVGSGKYAGDSVLRRNELNHLYFIENDGHTSTFIYPRTDYYFMIPNSIIEVKGYSRKFENGGNVPSYQKYRNMLSTNDVAILDIMRSVPIERMTTDDQEFISTFRGSNVVNSLSIDLITKLYGLMFKYHSITSPIHNILISNNGTGNLLNLAPSYVKNVFVDFADNEFRPIEEQINFAQNRNKIEFFQNSYKGIDAIIHVYPTTNPEQELIAQHTNKNPKGMIAIGVCEFSSMNHMNEFKKQIMGKRVKNENITLYVIKTGITQNGECTLIYILNRI
jgi:hypothetical protein